MRLLSRRYPGRALPSMARRPAMAPLFAPRKNGSAGATRRFAQLALSAFSSSALRSAVAGAPMRFTWCAASCAFAHAARPPLCAPLLPPAGAAAGGACWALPLKRLCAPPYLAALGSPPRWRTATQGLPSRMSSAKPRHSGLAFSPCEGEASHPRPAETKRAAGEKKICWNYLEVFMNTKRFVKYSSCSVRGLSLTFCNWRTS